jgi:hydroxymethylbilane synthase
VKTVVLGSRGSRLALIQAGLVKQALEQLAEKADVIIQIIRTTGDRRLDLSLSQLEEKIGRGLFTKELEDALLRREIDVAVHSLKDLPTEMLPELELSATLPRHDPSDVLISKSAKSLADIPAGGLVATSSVRRACQLNAKRPDLRIVDIRGNVPTRIHKLVNKDSWNSLVLAKAGLERLGYRLTGGRLEFESRELFATDLPEILPAAGQGAIGLETRVNDPEVHRLLSKINHAPTWFCTAVEREFLRMLGGGCNLPAGIRTSLEGRLLFCEAIVFDKNNKPSSGTLSGEFETPGVAASALLNMIYEDRK